MRFGRFSLDDAEGAVLAHSLRLPSATLKKGQRLEAADIAALRAAGMAEVTALRLEEDDVGEDEAAEILARAATGEGTRTGSPFTGRCNIYATRRGVALMERERVDRVNLIDEALTIATVEPYELVEEDRLVATVKVIPLAVSRAALAAGVAAAEGDGPLVRVAGFTAHAAGLVLTRLAGTRERMLDKTVATVRGRLEALGGSLAREVRCQHEEEAVAASIGALVNEGLAPILIFGASAIVDRRDVVPAAIELAGGVVDHLGMPVDPGNLLLLAHHGKTPVLGLPGSARSPRVNGFDWVLRRLLAGIPIEGRDLMILGAGGLLKEMPGRPQPRERKKPKAARRGDKPRIAALVLAAGQSRRMGRVNKLLAEIDGRPMVSRVVDAALGSDAWPVTVVTGHQGEKVRRALEGREVRMVDNPDYREGLSSSLRRGLESLPADVDGVLVCLGDMPRTNPAHLDRLIAAFDPSEGRSICLPTRDGKRGNPVLWGAEFFAEMKEVAGDVGARHLIGEHGDAVCEVPIDDEAIFIDIDTPEALTALESRGKRG